MEENKKNELEIFNEKINEMINFSINNIKGDKKTNGFRFNLLLLIHTYLELSKYKGQLEIFINDCDKLKEDYTKI